MRNLMLAALLTLSVSAARAADIDTRTLTGLNKAVICVEKLKDSAKDQGITESWAKSLVEGTARECGITTGSEDQLAAIYVNLNTMPIEDGQMVFSVRLAVCQTTTLDRDSSLSAFAVTWQRSTLGVGDKTKIEKALTGLLSALKKEYREANQPD